MHCQFVYPLLSKTLPCSLLGDSLDDYLIFLADFGRFQVIFWGAIVGDLFLIPILFSRLTSNTWLKIHVGCRKESAIRVREELIPKA